MDVCKFQYVQASVKLLFAFGLSNEQPTDERVLDYKTDITIGSDGVLEVTEQIILSA